MSNDNTLITEIPVLPVRTEAEWQAENPIIAAGYGAYSTDTHLMRVGDGSTRWNKLSTYNPTSYIGPHAHTHEVGGADPIDIYQYLNTPEGTVQFGTGISSTNRPESGYILDNMLLCSDSDDEEKTKSATTDQAEIFNSWKSYSISKISSQTSTSGVTVTNENNADPAELTAWSYNAENGTILNTTNSTTHIGRVSNKQYTDYIFEATIGASNNISDDDYIGVVLAYVESAGVKYVLSYFRSTGGNVPICGIKYNHMKTDADQIAYTYDGLYWGNGGQGDSKTAAGYSEGSTSNHNGWGFHKCRIHVERHGNVITCKTTNLVGDNIPEGVSSLDTYVEEATLTIDLDSDNRLAIFKQPCSIGYCCTSQAWSTWQDVVFVDINNKLYNIATNTLQEQHADGTWVTIDEDPYDYFQPGRLIYNDITRKLYHVKPGSMTELVQDSGSSNTFTHLHATAAENTPIAVSTQVKIPYTGITANTQDITYNDTTRAFTYQGKQSRTFQVTAKQRFARTSIAEADMNTSHNVVLSIVSSRANPVIRTEAYGIMVQGIPWMEIAVTKIMQLNTGDTFYIQAETAKEVRTYATSDDTAAPVNTVSTLDIVSLN